RNIVDAGHFISVPTLVCFSEHHREIAREVPLEHMLLETDSPYLSPRKGRNEPEFILDSLPWIEKLKGIEEKDIADITRKNTIRAFGL
ncbi:MAG: TatD family deoxyribonuclease, partial [Clostridiales bacterium]|nr:TatD family deoxyribonuclease [Clostridiales bacterium]